MWIFLLWAMFAADDSPALTQARQQLQAVRQQAAEGLVPASAISEAEDAVADATDLQILDETLYGRIQVEELTEAQGVAMVSAAERRVSRTGRAIDRIAKLADAGVADRQQVSDLEAELAMRSKAAGQAKARAALLTQLADMVRAETPPAEAAIERKPEEHVDGDHGLDADDIRKITLAYERQFREPLPVSARGETAVHRAMGFDHSGRIDVALTPDSPQGVWLRKFLEARSIPYYAFRVAIAGKATAPHIHIGAPSTRLAD